MISLEADNRQLLRQMAELEAKASHGVREYSGSDRTEGDFGQYLERAINEVDSQQNRANSLKSGFVREDPGISLGQVVIQAQKAEVALSALLAVRNRLVEGYKTVMNMSL